MPEVTDMPNRDEHLPPTRSVHVVALGERNPEALDCEVNLVGYFSSITRQQIVFTKDIATDVWHQTVVGVGGHEFHQCLLSRRGGIDLPRLVGGMLAAVSHPWSGWLQIASDSGNVRIDLYAPVSKLILIDLATGQCRDQDVAEIVKLRASLVDALSDPSLVDQRETGAQRAVPAASAVVGDRINQAQPDTGLGWVSIQAMGKRSELAGDEQVCVLEIEPMAGVFADMTRLNMDQSWTLEIAKRGMEDAQLAIVSREGQLKIRAAASGSVQFLGWPEGGQVMLEVFGITRVIDLYNSAPKLIRIHFDEMPPPQYASDSGQQEQQEWHQRRDFYNAALRQIDPSLPLGLYVPRWKGVAASTKNLFSQTLPFPHTAEGHPADISPEDVKFISNVLLSSGCRHFVISGGDTFWISVIRRVQKESSGLRFDLLWHSNYLQMSEAHDWNLLKSWLRAISDGLVTRVAVVKQGLEVLLGRLGVDAVFIPNVIRADPNDIRYAGAHADVGIWLSGSSSYRKLPYASLLALKALRDRRLVGAGFDDESMALVTDLRIPRGEIWRHPLPQESLYQSIQRTGLTLYVTLSECSPMLPLESLHLGVPCLVGANSHLFRDDPYLSKMLVVQSPLSPEQIATHALAALANGEAIIDAFVVYVRREQARAEQGLARLLA
jgi:hypothetical protein